jgi:ATP synthase protein I
MRPVNSGWSDEAETDVTPMSAQEAQAWRAKQPRWSVWRVLGLQLIGLLVLSALVGSLGNLTLAQSVAWGGVCVLVPSLLFARALSSSASAQAGTFLMRLLFWEGVKVLLTVALLFASPRVLPEINWLALVAGFVVTMKISWFAAFQSLRADR